MTKTDFELAQELADIAATKENIAEIVGEIERSKIEKTKINLNLAKVEKAKQHFDDFRRKKFGIYALILLVMLSFPFFGIDVFFKDDRYIFSIFIAFFGFSTIAYEKNEGGFLNHFVSDSKSRKDIDTYSYYIFGEVFKFRILAFILPSFLVSIQSFLLYTKSEYYFSFSLANITFTFILCLFFEYIFTKKER